MFAGEHGRDRTLDDDLAVGEHCDAVANGVETVEIMGAMKPETDSVATS